MTTITETEMNIMKEANRVHLRTPLGMEQLKNAVALQKEWRENNAKCDATFGTSTVKSAILHKSLQTLKKVKIIPIGINNFCHTNADIFADCGLGFTTQLGFNITACPCGRYYSLELHSLNKRDNEYYDFTKDFNNETEKWFIPLETELRPDEYIKRGLPQFIKQNRLCRCPIDWGVSLDPRIVEMDTLEMIDYFKMIKTIRPMKVWKCEDYDTDDEMPPHCHKCFNMNINMLVLPYVEKAICYNCCNKTN